MTELKTTLTVSDVIRMNEALDAWQDAEFELYEDK